MLLSACRFVVAKMFLMSKLGKLRGAVYMLYVAMSRVLKLQKIRILTRNGSFPPESRRDKGVGRGGAWGGGGLDRGVGGWRIEIP